MTIADDMGVSPGEFPKHNFHAVGKPRLPICAKYFPVLRKPLRGYYLYQGGDANTKEQVV